MQHATLATKHDLQYNTIMFTHRWHLEADLEEARIEAKDRFGVYDAFLKDGMICHRLEGIIVELRSAIRDDVAALRRVRKAREALAKT